MMNRILALILSLILLTLCGCTQHPNIDGSTPANSSSNLTDPSTDPSTNPAATNPTTEATVPTTVPVDENIAFFTDLFTFYYNPYDTEEYLFGINHYNMAMCCVFSSPEELNLGLFFYNGLSTHQVTEEEQNFVTDYLESTGSLPLGANRLVPEEMDEVLQAYFDITLDDLNKINLLYWDKTGYYYNACSDMLYREYYVIYAVEELDNGIFKICYTTSYEGDFVITLQSRASEGGEGFRILSNLPLVDPDALLAEEIEALEAIYTIYQNLTQGFPHNWYNATLGQVFNTPENLDVNNFFGHPGTVIPRENYALTDAEVDFLMNFPRMEACILVTETPIYRLARTDAEYLLKWYFDLELADTNITDVYWEETDCYYFALESGAILEFEVLEAKYLADDIIWFRYHDASSPYFPDYEATIRVYRDRFVLLSNKEAK